MIKAVAFAAAQGIARCFHGQSNSFEGNARALEALMNHLVSLGTWESSSIGKAHDTLVRDPKDRHAQACLAMWTFIGRWGALGCPVVRAEKEWAAAVCCSSIPEELFGLLSPPWDYFMVDVPQELGLTVWLARKVREIAYIKVGYARGTLRSAVTGELVDGWYISPCTANGDESPSMLFIRANQLFAGIGSDETVPDSCRKSLQLIGPLIGAICMAFANGETRRTGGRSTRAKKARGALYPTRHEYFVGKPVTVDLSSRVAAHIAGAGGPGAKLKVQGVVRGHWKNQAHGPGATERKFIHIEPYWRGPEDAPIAVRPHVLKGVGHAQ